MLTFKQHITELSKKTLGSYIKKSATDATIKSSQGSRAYARGEKETGNKLWDKSNKRHAGLTKATNKLTKEEVVTEELKVGDKAHLGHGQWGGAGYIGKVHKIEDKTIHLHISSGPWGPRIVKGPLKHAQKVNEEIVNELDIKDPKSTAQYQPREDQTAKFYKLMASKDKDMMKRLKLASKKNKK